MPDTDDATLLLVSYLSTEQQGPDAGLPALPHRVDALRIWVGIDDGRPYDGDYMPDSQGALAHLHPAERRFLDHHREARRYSRWAERMYQFERERRQDGGTEIPTRAAYFSTRTTDSVESVVRTRIARPVVPADPRYL